MATTLMSVVSVAVEVPEIVPVPVTLLVKVRRQGGDDTECGRVCGRGA